MVRCQSRTGGPEYAATAEDNARSVLRRGVPRVYVLRVARAQRPGDALPLSVLFICAVAPRELRGWERQMNVIIMFSTYEHEGFIGFERPRDLDERVRLLYRAAGFGVRLQKPQGNDRLPNVALEEPVNLLGM